MTFQFIKCIFTFLDLIQKLVSTINSNKKDLDFVIFLLLAVHIGICILYLNLLLYIRVDLMKNSKNLYNMTPLCTSKFNIFYMMEKIGLHGRGDMDV